MTNDDLILTLTHDLLAADAGLSPTSRRYIARVLVQRGWIKVDKVAPPIYADPIMFDILNARGQPSPADRPPSPALPPRPPSDAPTPH